MKLTTRMLCWPLHEDNDVLLRHSVLPEDLEGVADIRLVAVVVPPVGASCQDSPKLSTLGDGRDVTGLEGHAQGRGGEAQGQENGLHGRSLIGLRMMPQDAIEAFYIGSLILIFVVLCDVKNCV